jgi:hypothetical protein
MPEVFSKNMMCAILTIDKESNLDFISAKLGVFFCQPLTATTTTMRAGLDFRMSLLWHAECTNLDSLSVVIGKLVQAARALPALNMELWEPNNYEYLGPNCCRLDKVVRQAGVWSRICKPVLAVSFSLFSEHIYNRWFVPTTVAHRSPKVYLESTIVPDSKSIFVLGRSQHLKLQPVVTDCGDKDWLWWPNGGGLTIISTPFYKGRHWAESPAEFVPIALHLDEMHAEEIVHADIRAYNINFRKDSTGRSCLIDFDFSGNINEASGTPTYPVGYQQFLVDGMRKGKPGRQVTKWHDWAALLDVIFRVHGLEPPGRIDDDDLNRLWKELKLCMKIHPGTVQGLGRNLVTFLNKVDGTWTFTRESSFVEELDGWQASSRKHLVPEEEILIALHR